MRGRGKRRWECDDATRVISPSRSAWCLLPTTITPASPAAAPLPLAIPEPVKPRSGIPERAADFDLLYTPPPTPHNLSKPDFKLQDDKLDFSPDLGFRRAAARAREEPAPALKSANSTYRTPSRPSPRASPTRRPPTAPSSRQTATHVSPRRSKIP
ncbi:hypothetical protein K525DRAFT_275806 [Schizophyllum commune Loenen D]|nr:hypothetical protein K525DRAFT_275806 [Schizophyllum commune Loenen D]